MKHKRIFNLVFALLALGVVLLFAQIKEVEPPPPPLTQEKEKPVEIMSTSSKKQRFLTTLVPVVSRVHTDLMQRYLQVQNWLELGRKQETIAKLKSEYKVRTDPELLQALKPHPPSVALAQAAMESAWGTSRFFVEANNVFGVWSYNSNEARIAAEQQRGDKTIWIRKYDSLEASVRDYYRLLGRSAAYKEFRQLRMRSADPHELVKKLHRYSEKSHEYSKELSSVIRYNEFTRFDDDPY
ncbi:MAG: glucosaminidase domain-containing protein [Desulfuromonadaceae bacterium]|nr:glucosaminidase domain-containing protein [Desulfuromonadaceae bacterium]